VVVKHWAGIKRKIFRELFDTILVLVVYSPLVGKQGCPEDPGSRSVLGVRI
jgi:hypothetical protein